MLSREKMKANSQLKYKKAKEIERCCYTVQVDGVIQFLVHT